MWQFLLRPGILVVRGKDWTDSMDKQNEDVKGPGGYDHGISRWDLRWIRIPLQSKMR